MNVIIIIILVIGGVILETWRQIINWRLRRNLKKLNNNIRQIITVLQQFDTKMKECIETEAEEDPNDPYINSIDDLKDE